MSSNENNLVMTIVGNKLTIEVDLDRDLGPWGSGKTNLVATSRGNKEIEGAPGVFMGLSIFRKA